MDNVEEVEQSRISRGYWYKQRVCRRGRVEYKWVGQVAFWRARDKTLSGCGVAVWLTSERMGSLFLPIATPHALPFGSGSTMQTKYNEHGRSVRDDNGEEEGGRCGRKWPWRRLCTSKDELWHCGVGINRSQWEYSTQLFFSNEQVELLLLRFLRPARVRPRLCIRICPHCWDQRFSQIAATCRDYHTRRVTAAAIDPDARRLIPLNCECQQPTSLPLYKSRHLPTSNSSDSTSLHPSHASNPRGNRDDGPVKLHPRVTFQAISISLRADFSSSALQTETSRQLPSRVRHSDPPDANLLQQLKPSELRRCGSSTLQTCCLGACGVLPELSCEIITTSSMQKLLRCDNFPSHQSDSLRSSCLSVPKLCLTSHSNKVWSWSEQAMIGEFQTSATY
jgi:hypothetical protein